jgi:hypothetical protein
MKNLMILLLFSVIISCTPKMKLSGRYITNKQDTIIIDKTGTLKNSKDSDSRMIVKQRGNLLKFKTDWYGNNTLFNRPHKYYFKILKTTKEGVILSPKTKWSKLMFENRDSIFFKLDTTYLNRK